MRNIKAHVWMSAVVYTFGACVRRLGIFVDSVTLMLVIVKCREVVVLNIDHSRALMKNDMLLICVWF